MISVSLEKIAEVTNGVLQSKLPDNQVDHVCIDSKSALPKSLFVALKGQHTDGHYYLNDAFQNGTIAALVSDTMIDNINIDPSLSLIVVPSPLKALQLMAKWYRQEYIDNVLIITGSNGKTIVKDILSVLLRSKCVFYSPLSWNSQIGLPLAILSCDKKVELAVLEAGISELGEMTTLEEIAHPDFGILTNIGMAHIASFGSRDIIAQEKIKLFSRIATENWVLIPTNEPAIEKLIHLLHCKVHRLGATQETLALASLSFTKEAQLVKLTVFDECQKINIHTRSSYVLNDIHIAASAANLLGISLKDIALLLEEYIPTSTRTELYTSSNGIKIVNDAYSSDPISVHAALKSVALGVGLSGRKIFAFAGMQEMGAVAKKEHYLVGIDAGKRDFSHVFLVGNGCLVNTEQGFKSVQKDGLVKRVQNIKELKDQLLPILRPDDTVLFKGPRNSGMLKAAKELFGSISQRTFWVNMAAIAENISQFQRHTNGQAKIMVMLKALAYGTDLTQLAFWMSQLGIHHIGVSSTNEGVSIRKAGVNQDIFIFLSHLDDIESLLRYRLTPILYSKELVKDFIARFAGINDTLDVHLKIDTGMHRLGVHPTEALALAQLIRNSNNIRLTGVCTHFASAEDPQADKFTLQQISVFNHVIESLYAEGFTELEIHAANTAATIRFPQAHYNMVRVGIGLYGIYPSKATKETLELELAIALTSRIASVHNFVIGDNLGYNGAFIVKQPMTVGVVPFGYDDGLLWHLSGSGYHVLVEGETAPVVGRISMDQMQIDISGIDGAGVGSQVLLYGSHEGHELRPEYVANLAKTIPHELLIRLGKRIERVFIEP